MVFIVDTTTNELAGSIEAGQRPWGIAMSPDDKTIYTANGPSNDVSIIDIETKQVTKKIPSAAAPGASRSSNRSRSVRLEADVRRPG